jgi:soluble lytic murein transglycosylase-like protein
MTTGNHLTIRDYLDQIITGNQQKRKGSSPYSARKAASGKGMFHRMLISRQVEKDERPGAKITGLTIADYLANPLLARSQKLNPTSSSSNETKANESSDQPGLASSKDLAQKAVAASQAKAKKIKPLPSTALSPSVKQSEQSESHERQKIENSIRKAAKKYNLPQGLIKGVIRAESNFQIDAVSRAGAQGLMQLMPATARELGVTKPFDIDQNIDGGSRYLRKMLDNFGGNVKLALAAYNAGPGTVRKYEGKVPYPETIQYIDRVLRFSQQAA